MKKTLAIATVLSAYTASQVEAVTIQEVVTEANNKKEAAAEIPAKKPVVAKAKQTEDVSEAATPQKTVPKSEKKQVIEQEAPEETIAKASASNKAPATTTTDASAKVAAPKKDAAAKKVTKGAPAKGKVDVKAPASDLDETQPTEPVEVGSANVKKANNDQGTVNVKKATPAAEKAKPKPSATSATENIK